MSAFLSEKGLLNGTSTGGKGNDVYSWDPYERP